MTATLLGGLHGCGGGAATSDAGPPDAATDAGAPDAATEDAALRDAAADDAGGALLPPEPSAGCGAGRARYGVGTTTGTVMHGAAARTFRVRVPPGYDDRVATPVVLMFHGGGGTGLQLEERSSRMSPVADREGFVVVYPDGTGRTWNAGGCCGPAARDAVDDVGFVGALLDHLEQELCIDRRRVFASGMSNGAMMSHRLACEASDRIAAIAPVAGVEMSPTCAPARPVPVLQVHGTADGHVPWEGGVGCGLAGVAFTSVPATMEGWRLRNGCSSTTSVVLEQGDGTCTGFDGCPIAGETVLCAIASGGHSWPGGVPREGVVDCPEDGAQSTTFLASEQIWAFFSRHARP